jgi:phage major head subunit gpT-like protein
MITPAQMNVLRSTVSVLVGQVYSEDKVPLPSGVFCTDVTMGSSQLIDAWTGMLPKPRVWQGPRVHIQPALQTYTVAAVPYEGPSIVMDRFTLDDDQYGSLFRAIPDQVRQVRRLKDYWLRDLLEASGYFAGPNQLGFDGLSFFNTAHPLDVYNPSSATYSNDLTGNTGTTASPGGPFSVNGFATAAEFMMTIKAEDGERLGVIPTHAMLPIQLMTEGQLVLKSFSMAPPAWGTIGGQVGAADNPLLRFGVEPIINHFLASSTKWYLQDNSKAIKSMRFAMREAPVYSQRTAESDPIVYDLHMMAWGVWGRGVPAWSYSFLMLRSG